MKTDQIKNIWGEYNNSLEDNLNINKKILNQLGKTDISNNMNKLTIYRILEAIILFFIVGFLADFLISHKTQFQFAIPAAVLMVTYIIWLIFSIQQVAMTLTIDYSQSIFSIQKRISLLQSHNLLYLKFAIASIPFYMAYILIGFKIIWNTNLWNAGNQAWWISQFFFSLLLIPASAYVISRLNHRYIDKPWVKSLIQSSGGGKINDALEKLKELEKFKKEN